MNSEYQTPPPSSRPSYMDNDSRHDTRYKDYDRQHDDICMPYGRQHDRSAHGPD